MEISENTNIRLIMDIEKAIESVSDLKCGFQIVNIKNSKAVVTIPMEKSGIMDDIIGLASENGGWIGYSICKERKEIGLVQFEDAIERLMSHGVAWRDEQNFIHQQAKNDDIIYWFHMGAYNSSCCFVGFNGFPPVKTYVIDSEKMSKSQESNSQGMCDIY